MSNKISNKKLEASVKLDQSLSKASGKIVEKVEQLGRTSSNKTTVLSHSKTIQDVVKGAVDQSPPSNIMEASGALIEKATSKVINKIKEKNE